MIGVEVTDDDISDRLLTSDTADFGDHLSCLRHAQRRFVGDDEIIHHHERHLIRAPSEPADFIDTARNLIGAHLLRLRLHAGKPFRRREILIREGGIYGHVGQT